METGPQFAERPQDKKQNDYPQPYYWAVSYSFIKKIL